MSTPCPATPAATVDGTVATLLRLRRDLDALERRAPAESARVRMELERVRRQYTAGRLDLAGYVERLTELELWVGLATPAPVEPVGPADPEQPQGPGRRDAR